MREPGNLDGGSHNLRMLHDPNLFYAIINDEARKAPFRGSRKGCPQSQSREPIYRSETVFKIIGRGIIGSVSRCMRNKWNMGDAAA
jgi:hypothetical protein